MDRTFRRIVTGHDETGASVFLMDGEPPTVFDLAAGATRVIELWETRRTPASNAGSEEATGGPMKLPPEPNGAKFRIVRYPPDAQRLAALKEGARRHDEARDGYVRDYANARHPGFHKTNTLDFAIVLDGEIYAIMDKGERLMRAGDILIQRGTNHAWSNRTDAPVHVAFVLIDAEPV
ncbi:MAG TPA: cupin domain-containing protein [Beijerinckiaceae bacterium]|jgi:hypothetical protein